MAQIIFSKIQQGPGPDSRKVGKPLYLWNTVTKTI